MTFYIVFIITQDSENRRVSAHQIYATRDEAEEAAAQLRQEQEQYTDNPLFPNMTVEVDDVDLIDVLKWLMQRVNLK